MPGYNASTNQYTLAGTNYDANGDVLSDSFNSYTWDAEGKPVTAHYPNGQTWGFTYDAFGHRVELSTNGSYNYSYVTIGGFRLSATGQTAAYSEYSLPGGNIFSVNGGLTGLQMADWLGTIRAFYSYTGGNPGILGAHAPFGEAYGFQNWGGYPTGFAGEGSPGWGEGGDANASNTTYWFPERHYRSSQGRWLSPDPAGLGSVDPSNPQSWNRYAYVLNSPLTSVDPLGRECVWDDGSYDSRNDPDTGGYEQCTNAGGTWIEPQYFQTFGLGDWSADPNSFLADFVYQMQNAVPDAVVTGTPCAPPNQPPSSSASVDKNIQDTKDVLARDVQTSLNSIQSGGDGTMAPLGAYAWWYNKVRTGGTWDYASNYGRNSANSSFGNFNYGATCAALEFTLETCQRGAGAVDYYNATVNVIKGRSWSAGPGNPFTGRAVIVQGLPDYGDQTHWAENASVIAGWVYGSGGCH